MKKLFLVMLIASQLLFSSVTQAFEPIATTLLAILHGAAFVNYNVLVPLRREEQAARVDKLREDINKQKNYFRRELNKIESALAENDKFLKERNLIGPATHNQQEDIYKKAIHNYTNNKLTNELLEVASYPISVYGYLFESVDSVLNSLNLLGNSLGSLLAFQERREGEDLIELLNNHKKSAKKSYTEVLDIYRDMLGKSNKRVLEFKTKRTDKLLSQMEQMASGQTEGFGADHIQTFVKKMFELYGRYRNGELNDTQNFIIRYAKAIQNYKNNNLAFARHEEYFIKFSHSLSGATEWLQLAYLENNVLKNSLGESSYYSFKKNLFKNNMALALQYGAPLWTLEKFTKPIIFTFRGLSSLRGYPGTEKFITIRDLQQLKDRHVNSSDFNKLRDRVTTEIVEKIKKAYTAKDILRAFDPTHDSKNLREIIGPDDYYNLLSITFGSQIESIIKKDQMTLREISNLHNNDVRRNYNTDVLFIDRDTVKFMQNKYRKMHDPEKLISKERIRVESIIEMAGSISEVIEAFDWKNISERLIDIIGDDKVELLMRELLVENIQAIVSIDDFNLDTMDEIEALSHRYALPSSQQRLLANNFLFEEAFSKNLKDEYISYANTQFMKIQNEFELGYAKKLKSGVNDFSASDLNSNSITKLIDAQGKEEFNALKIKVFEDNAKVVVAKTDLPLTSFLHELMNVYGVSFYEMHYLSSHFDQMYEVLKSYIVSRSWDDGFKQEISELTSEISSVSDQFTLSTKEKLIESVFEPLIRNLSNFQENQRELSFIYRELKRTKVSALTESKLLNNILEVSANKFSFLAANFDENINSDVYWSALEKIKYSDREELESFIKLFVRHPSDLKHNYIYQKRMNSLNRMRFINGVSVEDMLKSLSKIEGDQKQIAQQAYKMLSTFISFDPSKNELNRYLAYIAYDQELYFRTQKELSSGGKYSRLHSNCQYLLSPFYRLAQ